VTNTRKTARPKKPQPKHAAAPKPAAAKTKKKAVAIVESAAAKPTTPNLMVTTNSSFNPLEEIYNLLDHLSLQACVELTRRRHTSISSLPTGESRPRAVLKTVILFVAVYGSTT
jgi:acetylglutamate synthase